MEQRQILDRMVEEARKPERDIELMRALDKQYRKSENSVDPELKGLMDACRGTAMNRAAHPDQYGVILLRLNERHQEVVDFSG